MYRIHDANRPGWQSLRYPTLAQAQSDILIAQAYAYTNNLPIPAFTVVEDN